MYQIKPKGTKHKGQMVPLFLGTALREFPHPTLLTCKRTPYARTLAPVGRFNSRIHQSLARTIFLIPKPTMPDQDSHKIPLSARSATSDYAYARRLVYSRFDDADFGNLDRAIRATVAEAGDRRREQSWGDTSQCNLFWGVNIMQRSRLPIQINQKEPKPAWMC
jgi:hypothetical protein